MDDLQDVVQYLQKQAGSGTDIIADVDNNFKGLFYQDQYMKNMFAQYPEMVLVDATYKLLELRMPVYLSMCIDGDGLSEIVVMFILAEETKEFIGAAVDSFKRHNPSWEKTIVVMSDDKDFTERKPFASSFPAAHLLIWS
jgi:zinc finger SWIM domain-containing protein 3